MPPVRRAPGSTKPSAPVTPDPSAENGQSAAKPQPEHPWSSPADVVDRQGLSMMLFSHPGIGKTTLGLTMIHSLDGGPMLIVNTDEELRSISDLGPDSGVAVWPGKKQGGKIKNWQQIVNFTSRLVTGGHPFKSLMFDTLNSLYDKFALPDVMQRNPGTKDPRQLYGEANDMVLRLITDFCGVAREQGINVLFTCHAEEKQVGENGPLVVRPKITPGVVLGLNQRVSIIGYLEPARLGTPRKLQLAPSGRVTAKIHQPRTGPQVPDKITDPDLGLLINHLKYKRPYPVKQKGQSSDD